MSATVTFQCVKGEGCVYVNDADVDFKEPVALSPGNVVVFKTKDGHCFVSSIINYTPYVTLVMAPLVFSPCTSACNAKKQKYSYIVTSVKMGGGGVQISSSQSDGGGSGSWEVFVGSTNST